MLCQFQKSIKSPRSDPTDRKTKNNHQKCNFKLEKNVGQEIQRRTHSDPKGYKYHSHTGFQKPYQVDQFQISITRSIQHVQNKFYFLKARIEDRKKDIKKKQLKIQTLRKQIQLKYKENQQLHKILVPLRKKRINIENEIQSLQDKLLEIKSQLQNNYHQQNELKNRKKYKKQMKQFESQIENLNDEKKNLLAFIQTKQQWFNQNLKQINGIKLQVDENISDIQKIKKQIKADEQKLQECEQFMWARNILI